MSNLIVREHSSSKYSPRTYYNAKSADLTVAFATDFHTAGEKCTKNAAGDKYLSLDLNLNELETARSLYKAMVCTNAKTLNIAGNGIYTLAKSQITQRCIDNYVYFVLAKVIQYLPIHKIYTGGQTGVDLAGARAAWHLGIDCEVTYPKGYLMRGEDKIDREHSHEYIVKLIQEYIPYDN